MTIAVHQPNYLPWPGYFYKIFASDVFVFHDAVEFSRTSYTRRCRIRAHKSTPETIWLSVPVEKHPPGTRIHDIQISHATHWAVAHGRKIENTYASAPYFSAYFPWLRDLLIRAGTEKSLFTCNTLLIREIASALSLHTEYHSSSVLPLTHKGSALNLEIAQHFGATHYLAGTGSTQYQDDDSFVAAGVRPLTHDLGGWLASHPYEQGTGTFTGGLSIVDVLMHVGMEGVLQIFHAYDQQSRASSGLP